MFTLSATELGVQYATQELSPVEVTNDILARAQRLEPTLNAFRLLDKETALDQARASEKRWRVGSALSPLDGVPISIKDIVAVKGHACLSGSLTNNPDLVIQADCPSVARLRESGAVIFGLTHTPEFGWKGITDTPMHGATRNPWNTDHSPGGSSGGAAASVAAGISPLALGTDGGGSVRIPSSYSGLYGIKPTFGRVPHTPNESPYATLVSNGPLARTVEDAANMLAVMAQPDASDWYSAVEGNINYSDNLDVGIRGLKIAYSPELGGARPTSEVRDMISKAVNKLEDLGAHVEEVGQVFSPLRPVFEDYWKAGFGYILNSIPVEKWPLLDPGFRSLAEQGLNVDLNTYYKAISGRVSLGVQMGQFFEKYDLLITPTMPATAPKADVVYHSAEFDRWDDATPYTVPFNLTGHPAASIPVGLAANGLPVGMQIVGARFNEKTILQASRAYEKISPWCQDLNVLIEGLGDNAG
jgi:aspartyl-tRNA(Asn)/glutamyl-tRNA(Gln) amidotransferase subunit A